MVDLYHCNSFIFRTTISVLSFDYNESCSFIHDFIHFLQPNPHFQAIKGILTCILYRTGNINTCLPISARNINF